MKLQQLVKEQKAEIHKIYQKELESMKIRKGLELKIKRKKTIDNSNPYFEAEMRVSPSTMTNIERGSIHYSSQYRRYRNNSKTLTTK